ncbi:MAG: sigma 54-interacting transcriptional regulator [bacterium]|nr:sigma 54-interacting transcriptional regulator [bacterium]
MKQKLLDGKYKILEELGSGGMGKVFKVADTKEKSTLALKISSPEFAKKEFLTLSKLQHPNIVKVYDFFIISENEASFTMEYVNGCDLSGLFKKKLPHSKNDYVLLYDVILQICDALKFLHFHKFIHSDIKPANILIDFSNAYPRVVLTDFGLMEKQDIKKLKGTLQYIAPELLKGETITPNADLFSLGVTLYRLITHRMPFNGKNAISLIREHTKPKVIPPKEINTTVPDRLNKIILDLLQTNPLNRIASANALQKTICEISEKQYPITVSLPLFIEREKELSILKNIWQKVKSGKGQAVLITANKGVGKTRLLQEFTTLVKTEKVKIKELDSKTEIIPAEIKNIPLVLLMDGIHTQNENSVSSVERLIKKIEDVPVLIIMTSATTAPINKELLSLPYFEHINLLPLNLNDTNIMTSSMLLTEIETDGLGSLIYDYTKGNPFLIKTFTQNIVENKLLKINKEKWMLAKNELKNFPLTESIEKFVGNDLKQLNKDELNLLQIGALLKNNFTTRILEHLVKNPASVNKLVEKGILAENSSECYSFNYQLMPLVIEKQTPHNEKILLHSKIATTLETQFKKSQEKVAPELTYHYLYADEQKKAYHFALVSAEKFKKSYANADAIEYFELALSLADKIGKQEDKAIFYESMGDVYKIMGNCQKSLENYNACLTLTSKNNLAMIYRKIGLIHRDRQDYEKALSCFKKGMDLSTDGNNLKPLLLCDTGWICMCQKEFKKSLSCYESALKEAQKHNNKFALSYAYSSLGGLYFYRTDYKKSSEYYSRSLVIAREIKDDNLIESNLYNLGQILLKDGKLKEVEKLYEEALTIVKNQNNTHSIAMYYKSLGLLACEQGNLDQAVENYDSALEMLKKTGDKENTAGIYVFLGNVNKIKGNFDNAIKDYEYALLISGEIKNFPLIAGIHDCLGTIYKETEDFYKAIENFEKSLEIKKQFSDMQDVAYTIQNIGIVYTLQGNFDKAISFLKESYLLHQKQKSKIGMANICSSMAEYYLLRNDLSSAEKYCLKGNRLSEEVTHSSTFGITQRTLATVYLRKGQTDDAIKFYCEAIEIFRKIKADESLALTFLTMGQEVFAVRGKIGRRFWREELLEQLLNGLKEAEILFKKLNLPKRLERVYSLSAKFEEYSPLIFEPVPGEDKKLKTLYRIAQIVNSTLNINELLAKILDIVIELMEAERGFILIREKDKLEVKIARNMDKQSIKDMTDFSITIVEDAAKKGELVITSDAQNDDRFKSRKSIADFKLLSILCVPFKIKERIVGAIYADNRKRKNAFSTDDLEFLQAFCDQASIALENAILMKKLKTANEILEMENLTMKDEINHIKNELEERYGFCSLIGKSKPMQEVYDILEKIAKYDSSLVIEGETGTGKELVANIIHHNCSRKDKNFIAINSSAIPENLLESEMFGYTRGAFTGANQDKPGLFEIADGGTIFFDEIADLSQNLQAKLLRVLQDGEIRRIGANTIKRVNVRIVAATNKSLAEQVKDGKFREDLYYRLKVMYIKMPPLRERGEDVLLLANFILSRLRKKLNKMVTGFTPEVEYFFQNYAWPGNVRELQNVIERAIIMTEGKKITDRDLPSALTAGKHEKDGFIFPCSLEVLEKKAILSALELTGNNKRKTAKILGTSRPTLDKKLEKYKLS